jgi:putative transposase
MKTHTTAPNYKGFRFPSEIISHAVWLYFRFSLSYRDVEELLAQRRIIVTYETVRQWCLKFGQTYAKELRRRRPRCGDKWHMDEVILTIRGKNHILWRAVDQDGNVLDIRVAEPTPQKSGQTLLPKTPQRTPLRPACDQNLQAQELWGGQTRDLAWCGASAAQRTEQPGGKFVSTPSPYTTAREENAQIQISKTCTTFSFCLWSHLRPFSTAKASFECSGLPCRFTGSIPAMQ